MVIKIFRRNYFPSYCHKEDGPSGLLMHSKNCFVFCIFSFRRPVGPARVKVN